MPGHGAAVDIIGDCVVNLKDYAILESQWLQAPGIPSADIAPEPPDGIVEWRDLNVLVNSGWVDGWRIVRGR
ncbi:MAG: hypothetical protein ACYS21_15930 [Planctomycetota bacterium]